MNSYQKLCEFGRKNFDLKISFKDESRLMRVLGKLLFFNSSFMTTYSTTIGKTVYFPSKKWLSEDPDRAARVLAHEIVHLADAKRFGFGGFLFSALYLAPQIFALLALLSIWFSGWWLLSLLFLLPWPAYYRMFFEMRGYAMSDAVAYKRYGDVLSNDFLSKQFMTSSYYFMWPFRKSIDSYLTMMHKHTKDETLQQVIFITNDILRCFDDK